MGEGKLCLSNLTIGPFLDRDDGNMTSFSVVMVMVTSGAGGLAEISQADQKHVIPVEAAYEFGPRKMMDGSTRVPQKKW